MDPMMMALQKRKGLLGGDKQEAMVEEKAEAAPKKGMAGLVDALSEDQKQQLLAMLVKDQASGPAEAGDTESIAKGAPGPGEMEALADEAEGEGIGMADLGEGHESEDEIAESMISSADKMRADKGVKPRNLGERVKVGLASKLKQKGKY